MVQLPLSPLRDVAAGASLAFVLFFLASGCVAACGSTQLVECRISALKVLPEDPEQMTLLDLIDVKARIKACAVSGDAGR